MSLQATPVAQAHAAVRQGLPAAAAAFGLTLFSSAFLLFWIEPLFARMLLPRLGGSQGVWNTCLVFFQASLLLGYGYAHLLARFLSLRNQVLVHVLVVAAGWLFLPLAIGTHWAPPDSGSPVIPLFALLIGTLGWPFFALSANTPLLQHWFSFTPHREARNPYFLYALSNAGSLAALLFYPFLLEPNFTLSHQAALWASGYFALTVMIALAGGSSVFAQGRAGIGQTIVPASRSIDWKTRLTWLVYAALPSSLLIGVTGYITTDIASFPLLWIAPLALYLTTFVFAFAGKPPIPHGIMIELLPFGIVLAAAGFWLAPASLIAAIAVELIAFFIVAMTCHGELARLKPAADRLTEFYFWLSLGGVIGGALTALVSPLLFKDIIEYPLALAFVCLLRPGQRSDSETARIGQYVLLSLAILLVLIEPLASYNVIISNLLSVCLVAAVVGLALWSQPRNWLLIALALLLGLQYEHALVSRYGATIWRGRSFYGAYSAIEDRRAGYRMMFHGRTIHGVERLAGIAPPQPLSYYSAAGPLGDIMRAIGPRSHDIGLIGLGIGSTGCYARAGQSWTFYELDGLVDDLARHSGLFHSLSACAPDAKVVLGDGRMNLEREGAGLYDILLLDAFSSDAIPIHLLTREAFATYVRALKPHGVLAIHITNRHFDLAPIIARIAPGAGLVAYERSFSPPPGTNLALTPPSRWMVLARDRTDLGGLADRANWTLRPAMPATKLWTDDFSNILSALR